MTENDLAGNEDVNGIERTRALSVSPRFRRKSKYLLGMIEVLPRTSECDSSNDEGMGSNFDLQSQNSNSGKFDVSAAKTVGLPFRQSSLSLPTHDVHCNAPSKTPISCSPTSRTARRPKLSSSFDIEATDTLESEQNHASMNFERAPILSPALCRSQSVISTIGTTDTTRLVERRQQQKIHKLI